MAIAKKRPGAKKILSLTDAQRRVLAREFQRLALKTQTLNNIPLTPAAKAMLRKEVAAIVRRINKASNLLTFGG